MTFLADLALVAWVPISLALFLALGRPLPAACLTILGALLFLPKQRGFDLPLVPTLDAFRIGLLSAFGFTIALYGNQLRLRRGIEAFLVLPVMIVLGPVLTIATNRDPLSYGPLTLPALTTHDMISICLQQAIDYGVPFCLGLLLFRRARDLRFIMVCLVAAGFVYSFFIGIELRLSPQFHNWVYGYHQHQFLQTVRDSGFRPMVFMTHGLELAGFLLAVCIAAWSLWRARVRVRGVSMLPVAGYLSIVLVACKSLAAAAYGLFVLPLTALAGARAQVRVAALLAALVMTYPALRAADLMPVETMVGLAKRVSEERASSLQFRLVNEQLLLAKARERLLFGWGTWGRNRVYDENSGEDIAVTDGAWIIELGRFGLVGFLGKFGLLAVPIFAAQRRLRRLRSATNRTLLGGFALILAVSLVDLLPNSFLTPITIFLSGGLAALTRGLVAEERAALRGEERRRRDAGSAVDPGAGSAPPATAGPAAGIAARLLTRRPVDRATERR